MASHGLLALDATLLYRIISIICQTLFYGIYLCLVIISVHVIVTNGIRSRSRKWLLAMTTMMFALSTMYWILSVVITFLVIDTYIGTRIAPDWLPMFSAILLINYIITDGVVVWRAWVLCSDQSRVALMIPVVMLAINTVIYLMTVAVRGALLSSKEGVQMHNVLARMIDVTQVAHQAFSLLTNVFATSVIALKAWKYRKLLMASEIGARYPSQAIRILAVMVESGMLYILIGVTALASLVIHLPFGTLGDIFMPVAVQLVGMYPMVVVLLVEQNRSINSTYCSFGATTGARGGPTSQTGPMSFAPGPVLTSSGQIDLATEPQNTDIHVHVSFSSMLEPGDAEMDAGSNKVSGEKYVI